MKFKGNNFGFTLIELLIYIVVAGIIAGVISQSLITIIRSHQKISARAKVNNQLNFAIQKITQGIRSAISIDESQHSLPGNWLDLSISSDGSTTTLSFYVENGILKKKIGDEDPVDITSDEVIVSGFNPPTEDIFSKIVYSNGDEAVLIKMKMTYNSAISWLSLIESKIETTIGLR